MNAPWRPGILALAVAAPIAPGLACLPEEPNRVEILAAPATPISSPPIAIDDRPPPEAPTLRPKPLPLDGLDCLACHTAFSTLPVIHAALTGPDRCFECHRAVAEEHPVCTGREFEFRNGGGEALCVRCHADKSVPIGRHAALAEGCVRCHDPHAASHEHLLDATPGGGLCAGCHDAEVHASVHPPYADGECSTCHDPHRSDQAHLLRADTRELCTSCHQPIAIRAAAADAHRPVRDVGCVACHDGHGGEQPGLLSRGVFETCAACHAAVAAKRDAAVAHPPLENCVQCHDPHGRESERLLALPSNELCQGCHPRDALAHEPGAEWHGALDTGDCVACHDPHGSYADKLVRGPSAVVCGSCHADVVEGARSDPFVHAPVGDPGCTACHEPHASAEPALAKRGYSRRVKLDPFDPGRVGLCFECHDADMVTPEFAGTGFRNGDVNLHWLHTGREGRNCRSCHAPHSTDQEHLIRRWLPFGESGFQLEIEYVATPSGGTCTRSCHQERSYAR